MYQSAVVRAGAVTCACAVAHTHWQVEANHCSFDLRKQSTHLDFNFMHLQFDLLRSNTFQMSKRMFLLLIVQSDELLSRLCCNN